MGCVAVLTLLSLLTTKWRWWVTSLSVENQQVSTIGRASVRLARNTPNFFLNMFFILNFWEYFLFDPKNFIISFYSNLLKGISFSFLSPSGSQNFFGAQKCLELKAPTCKSATTGRWCLLLSCALYITWHASFFYW